MPCIAIRASHFFHTPKAGEAIEAHRLRQVGRALRELGVQMIPAYSPQGRGRSERNFRTWQGRLPQELRLRGITTVEAANRFLRQHYIAVFNRKFQVAASETGTAFVPLAGQDLELGRLQKILQLGAVRFRHPTRHGEIHRIIPERDAAGQHEDWFHARRESRRNDSKRLRFDFDHLRAPAFGMELDL